MNKRTFKQHPFLEGVWVSKSGGVINTLTDGSLRIVRPYGYGHRGWYKATHLKGKPYPIHHLVVQTFIQEEWDRSIYEIDHIDGNPSNNKLNNLRILTITENRQNITRRFKPIKITNVKTGEVIEAKSGIEAAEILNTERYYVSNALKQGKLILDKTYKLEYLPKEWEQESENESK